MNTQNRRFNSIPSSKFLVVLVLLVISSGCAFQPGPLSRPVPDEDLNGVASWYGNPYHGRKTANGETYDMGALTAAHRTLPFQSIVRVRRSDDGREVEVRVNDRGPFVANRVIDLSREAARRIGMLRKGTTWVRLEPLHVPRSPDPKWMILVGGFKQKPEAQDFADYFRRRGTIARIRPGWHGNQAHYHVQLRELIDERSAKRLARKLRRNEYGAFVVRTK